MGLKRREFLQKASWMLAAMGISEAGLWQARDRYSQALAEPAPRKLALLVGIDEYPSVPGLTGCVTDVELQRELLIHRFGFAPEDIVSLTNAQATRKNIEETFMDHLSETARAGDLVVFHFSGYGRRVNWEESPEGMQNSLMPVDGGVPSGSIQVANDLLEETLWQMLRSLQTDRAIAVLDTSYNYPGTNLQGNLRIRSQPSLPGAKPSETELAFQEQLQRPKGFLQRSPSPFKGVVLTASASNQIATEARWNGFSAGLFTYALTQQLWLATPQNTLRFNLQRATCAVQQMGGISIQQPQLLKNLDNPAEVVTKGEDGLILPSAFTQPPADGVVIGLEDSGQTAVIWLGGLPAHAIDSYEPYSILTPLPLENSSEPSPKQLQVRSRDGLSVKAQVLGTGKPNAQPPSPSNLKEGQLVQETIRVLPRNIGLTIALDSGLQRIERVDATSAFAGIPRVTVVAGEQPADYLFGRARDALLAQLPNSSLPSIPQGSYALFSLGKNLLIETLGERGEAIKTAAQRLTPQLQTLLAAKLVRLSTNEGSSRLGVRATLETIAPAQKVLMQSETRRARWKAPREGSVVLGSSESRLLSLPLGSRIRYHVHNYSDRPVYCLLFGLDNSGSAIALYPSQDPSTSETGQTQPTVEQNIVPPGETLTIPSAAGSSSWILHGQAGYTETQVIFSSRPFSSTFAALSGSMRPQGDAQPLIPLRNPLNVAQSILQDLHIASASTIQTSALASDRWALDVNSWATLSFIYRVG